MLPVNFHDPELDQENRVQGQSRVNMKDAPQGESVSKLEKVENSGQRISEKKKAENPSGDPMTTPELFGRRFGLGPAGYGQHGQGGCKRRGQDRQADKGFGQSVSHRGAIPDGNSAPLW
jgi:hypothetical protein